MPQYLVAGYLPVASSIWDGSKSLRGQTDGEVLITDGPYLETKEHIGGFWILECADMDEAMAWARKGVAATRGQVEVREIFFQPSPDEQLSGGLERTDEGK